MELDLLKRRFLTFPSRASPERRNCLRTSLRLDQRNKRSILPFGLLCRSSSSSSESSQHLAQLLLVWSALRMFCWYFSVAHERETHPLIHVERERIVRTTSRLQPAHTRVAPLSQGHPGLCDTPRGSRQDTHGTRGPVRGKAVGGPRATPPHDNTTTRQTRS